LPLRAELCECTDEKRPRAKEVQLARRLETEQDGRVLIVRIDNPPRNFMDRQMVAELIELARSVASDRSVGSLVVTGKPNDLFITHYDVAEMLVGAEQSPFAMTPPVAGASYRMLSGLSRLPGARALLRRTPVGGVLDLHELHGLFRALERLDKVVIAAINGNALSIGCELALACDVRYMADDAPRIGLPEITLGIIPGGGGAQRLARTVGQARALELILEGRLLTPEEALGLGLVDKVMPRARLLDEAVATAHRLARRAPISVAAAKRALYEGVSRPLGEGLALERNWFLAAVSREPARRALARYLEEARGSEQSPWEDAGAREAWRQGTAVDLLSRDGE